MWMHVGMNLVIFLHQIDNTLISCITVDPFIKRLLLMASKTGYMLSTILK